MRVGSVSSLRPGRRTHQIRQDPFAGFEYAPSTTETFSEITERLSLAAGEIYGVPEEFNNHATGTVLTEAAAHVLAIACEMQGAVLSWSTSADRRRFANELISTDIDLSTASSILYRYLDSNEIVRERVLPALAMLSSTKRIANRHLAVVVDVAPVNLAVAA
jgi:hypothetical protein